MPELPSHSAAAKAMGFMHGLAMASAVMAFVSIITHSRMQGAWRQSASTVGSIQQCRVDMQTRNRIMMK